MAPEKKNPYEFRLPDEDSWLKKYNAQIPPDTKPGSKEKPATSDKSALDTDQGQKKSFLEKMVDKSEGLTEELEEYSEGKPASTFKQFWILGKVLIYFSILILVFIITLILPLIDIVKYITWFVVVKIIGTLLKIHMVYTICILALLLLAGAYVLVYNPYLSPAPVTDLHLKSPDGKTMQITNNRSASDATYAQVLQFLAEDETDSTLGRYQTTRVAAAVKLHDNAEKNGIRAGVAEVGLDNIYANSYCWNVFNTTDHGTIYVTAFHPVLKVDSDSFIYIPKSGQSEGQIYFIPVENVVNVRYDSLSEDMGKTAVSGKVIGVNVIW